MLGRAGGHSNGNGAAQGRAPLPAASNPKEIALLATAKAGVEDYAKVEVTVEPPQPKAQRELGRGRREGLRQRRRRHRKREWDGKTYTVTITAGRQHEEFNHVAASGIATLNRSWWSSSSAPKSGARALPGTYFLSAPPVAVSDVTTLDLEGNVTRREGLGSLAAIEDISMVCVPDIMSIAVHDGTALRDAQGKVIAHCEAMADRMAILDTPPELIPSDALDWRVNEAGYDSKQATLYYPWLEVMNPLSGSRSWFRRADTSRAYGHGRMQPAECTRRRRTRRSCSITGLGFQVTAAEQGDLNRAGLNCIRSFPGRGIRVWGARTISSDPEWRYVNVRRLFNYVSDSIMQGTQWAVFEPNDERLWIQLQIAVTNFLTIAWRNGALFGGTPEDAFYVKCDNETNPPEMIDAGQVTTEVGIAPVKPAEFVVFKISQYTAGENAGA